MTCRNILAQIQPRSGGGVKEGVGLHSQDSWMVGINRQINAGVPIATALIAFLKWPSKHRVTFVTYLCRCKPEAQVNVSTEMEDRSRKPFRSW